MSSRDLELPPAALLGIRAAFGETAAFDVCVLPGGRSGARVFSLRVAGQSYVLRVPSPNRDAHEERCDREITSMALAAERGIAPVLCYADRSTGLTISAKVEGILTGRERALSPGRLERLVSTVRAVHDGPRLPRGATVAALMDYYDGALRARGAGGIPAALALALREATEASRKFGKRAPCHGDLNPSNVLETPERTYLVDWETAGEGDPFVDVAQLGVFSFFASTARVELLAAYLGRAPTPSEAAHAALARVTALGFYAVTFVAAAVFGGATVPDDTSKARPLCEIVPDLAQGKASASDVAASLQRAALQESASDACRAALREGLAQV